MNKDKIYSELMKGSDKTFDGVLSGLAGYLGLNKTFVRFGYFMFAFFSGFVFALLLYFAFSWLIVPDYNKKNDLRLQKKSNFKIKDVINTKEEKKKEFYVKNI